MHKQSLKAPVLFLIVSVLFAGSMVVLANNQNIIHKLFDPPKDEYEQWETRIFNVAYDNVVTTLTVKYEHKQPELKFIDPDGNEIQPTQSYHPDGDHHTMNYDIDCKKKGSYLVKYQPANDKTITMEAKFTQTQSNILWDCSLKKAGNNSYKSLSITINTKDPHNVGSSATLVLRLTDKNGHFVRKQEIPIVLGQKVTYNYSIELLKPKTYYCLYADIISVRDKKQITSTKLGEFNTELTDIHNNINETSDNKDKK